jgi:TP53 regulating kinase-like protein
MSLKPELELLAQGAEGRVYRDFFMGQQCVRKVRFCKKYRHPVIDEKLTASRLAKEARNLARSSKFGISVPAVLFVDAKNSSLYLEYIPSPSVKSYLSTLSIGEEGLKNIFFELVLLYIYIYLLSLENNLFW